MSTGVTQLAAKVRSDLPEAEGYLSERVETTLWVTAGLFVWTVTVGTVTWWAGVWDGAWDLNSLEDPGAGMGEVAMALVITGALWFIGASALVALVLLRSGRR